MIDILRTQDLKKVYVKHGVSFTAVHDVNIRIPYGKCVGLVGESGCGKSTIAKLITKIEKPSCGKIYLEGSDISEYSRKEKRRLYSVVQMIFQNPVSSFDPRMKLGRSAAEPLINSGCRKKDAVERCIDLFKSVGLKEECFDRYPGSVSGGECQRAAIARAVSVKPKLLICDEATSSLDVSVQAQIVRILKKMQKEFSLSMLFICHDLALVYDVCDSVYVMHDGCIAEYGTCDKVIKSPSSEYTKLLLRSSNIDYDEENI